MSKLRKDLRVALAGVGCGLFSFSAFLLAARIDSFYAYLRWRENTDYGGTYDRGVEDLWWVPVVVWHVALSMMASLIVHHYQAAYRMSPFLRWQAIGSVALLGWGLTVFTAFSLGCLMNGSIRSIRMLTSDNFISVAQFISTIFASNVLFGSAVQAASSEDLREANHSPTTNDAI